MPVTRPAFPQGGIPVPIGACPEKGRRSAGRLLLRCPRLQAAEPAQWAARVTTPPARAGRRRGIRPLREATQGAAEKRLLPPKREGLPAEKALREAGLKQEGRLCKENARFALEGCAAGSRGVVREKDQARRLALCALGFRDGKHAAGTFRRRGVTAGPSCKRRASDRGFFHLG